MASTHDTSEYNHGATNNIYDGVYSGEPRRIEKPAIAAIGTNKLHPDASNVGPAPSFTNGKVPTKRST